MEYEITDDFPLELEQAGEPTRPHCDPHEEHRRAMHIPEESRNASTVARQLA